MSIVKTKIFIFKHKLRFCVKNYNNRRFVNKITTENIKIRVIT